MSLAIIGLSYINAEGPHSTGHEAALSNSAQQSSKQEKLVYPSDHSGREAPWANAASLTQFTTLPPLIIAVKPQGTPIPDDTSPLGAPFEGTAVGDLEVRVRRGSGLKRVVMEAENTMTVDTNSEELRLMLVNTPIDTPPITPVACNDWAENSLGLSPLSDKKNPKYTHIFSALDTLRYNMSFSSQGGVNTGTGSMAHRTWMKMSGHRLYASTAKEFRPPTPPASDEAASFEDLESPLGRVIIVADVLARFIFLLRAEVYILLLEPDNSDIQQSEFALFEELLSILKELTYMNDEEFPETGNGDEDTAKYRFEGRPCQQDPRVCFSFKPVGTTALNKNLCSLLHKVTGPIQIKGKYPLKTFDGSSKGRVDEVKHKRQITEREYQSFVDAARPLWGNLSGKKQHQLCKGVVDALIVLFLYWGYFLCLEKRLHLAENDRQKVKKACQDQLEKITLACVDKGGRIKGSSFIMIYQEDAEECHYGSHRSQLRNNSGDNSRVRGRSRSRARSHSSYGRPGSSCEAGERIGSNNDKHRGTEQPQFDLHQQQERDGGVSTQEWRHWTRQSISSTSTPRNFMYADNSPPQPAARGAAYGEPKDRHRHNYKTPTASDLREI
ncbi:hypothetical protein BGX38DRAFT_1269844 [Terfezia claveryi]|nr:hypothetical protein BGX38DRAFT_1269844 [Terfezia claveryi]